MAYYDADGNEVEGVITQAEADEQIAEKTKEQMELAATAKAEAEQKTAEATALQAKIDEAAAAQAAAGGEGEDKDKDKNLAALRKKLEETEASIVTEREATTARITALEGDKVAQAIAAVASGDADLAAKIKHNYDTTLSAVKASTAEEISQKVENAVKLSISAGKPNPLDMAAGGGAPQGSGGAHQPSGSKVEFNENEKAVGNKMGISDADREKYGPKLSGMNTK